MNEEIKIAIKDVWTTIDKLYALYSLEEHPFELSRMEYIRRNLLKLQRKNEGFYEKNE